MSRLENGVRHKKAVAASVDIMVHYCGCSHTLARESVYIDITKQVDGLWYTIMCYNLTPEEVISKLPEIEASLVAALNALHKNKTNRRKK